CSQKVIIKAGPAATAVKLCRSGKERVIATATDVRPLFECIFILSRKRWFRSFVLYDVPLFLCEHIPVLHEEMFQYLCKNLKQKIRKVPLWQASSLLSFHIFLWPDTPIRRFP